MSARKMLHERLDCGCRIESPPWKNRWRVTERGIDCRIHIVGERLNVASGKYGVQPR